jgi:branched-subunit amino acid aminotransferase/4-amino-4-deoxychorismate lyase
MELDGAPVTAADLATLALTGYGHFTTMAVADLRVRGLGLHLDRLARDCRALFGVDLAADRVVPLVRRVAARVAGPATVRVTVFDPGLELARPERADRPRILVTARPAPDVAAVPPLRVRPVRYVRDLPDVKHTGLLGALWQRRSARAAGFDDALLVTADGHLAEGPTWNVGVVRDGRVRWPAARRLPGVTECLLRRLLDEAGVDHRTTDVKVAELSGRTAVFATSAVVGVRPVGTVDDVVLGVDPVVAELGRAYRALPGEPLD